MHAKTVISLLAALLVSAPPASSQNGFAGPGSYQFTNVKSGKALAMDPNNRSSVTQFSPQRTESQVWILEPAQGGFFYIRNAANGNAMEPSSGQKSAPVMATRFRGTVSQQWRLQPGKDGNALIVNYYGKTLDVPDGTSRDGVGLQIYDLNGDSNQRFVVQRVSGQYGGGWRGPGSPGGPGPGYPPGPGGPGGRPPQGGIITCSSNDGRRNYCAADTRGGVIMSRQISGSPCRLNSTWGFDNRGIWVDQGCRAEFQLGGR
jgi:hypothetical protein